MNNYIGTIAQTLPNWQPPIETFSVTDLRGFVHALIQTPELGYFTIGIVHGPSGIGKTTGVLACIQNLTLQAHTGLPAILSVGLEPDVSGIGLLDQILEPLEVKPRGRTHSERLKQVKKELIGNDIKLVVFDDAENLTTKTFATITFLRDHARCPILLTALPEILTVVQPHEKLDSRAICEYKFLPLDENEAITQFFPGLIFPRWSFDPQNPEDQILGRFIWKKYAPSLRRACSAVMFASLVALTMNAAKVQMIHVEKGMTLMRKKASPSQISNMDMTEIDPRYGEYEKQSEQRHAAKQASKKK